MIKSFKHKGLKVFFETGSKAGIQPKHAVRLRLMLTMLDNAKRPDDMNAPGWRFHQLTGDKAGHYSVTVNGNWAHHACEQGFIKTQVPLHHSVS